MDRIRDLEEAGKLGTKLTNRTLRKLMSNKIAVFGAVMFVIICILCFGEHRCLQNTPLPPST